MLSHSSDFDVAVIGAGAAGLCAAAELSREGCSVLLLEARERIGGRIHTLLQPELSYPVELGAEFIHGGAPATTELLRAAGIAAVNTAGARVIRHDGELRARRGEFDEMQRLMRHAASLEQDLSLEQFLARHAGEYSPEAGAAARMMVEGFDAADPWRVSVKAIAEEWSGSGVGGQSRPLGGYSGLMAYLARCLDPAHTQVMLGTPVESVEWGGQNVTLTAHSAERHFSMSTRCALLTCPLSLLQQNEPTPGVVRFEPALTDKRAALAALAFGPVVKVMLQFRRPFWEELQQGRFADAGFLHAPEAPFPTLWTALPLRVPVLTAWMAGPRAQRQRGASRTHLIEQALDSVQCILGVDTPVADELVASYVHDWNADPYARGAYSYIAAGGGDAPEALATPLRDRLFFAGEATDREHVGTVEAALASGMRAAREVSRALRARGRAQTL